MYHVRVHRITRASTLCGVSSQGTNARPIDINLKCPDESLRVATR